MSMTLPLPPSIQGRLSGLAGRVRRLRGLRGVGRLLLLLAVGAGAALAADFLIGLPPLARLAMLTAWGLLGTWALARGVIAPLTRRLDDADLAAAVEGRYPELGERLLSSVELSRDERPSSPALARLLMDETEARSSRLDFDAAAPARAALRALALGLVAVVILVSPAPFAPALYARLVGRFLSPFSAPAVDPDYAFTVEPGDATGAKGRVLPIRVTLRPRDELVKVPPVLTFVVRDAQGERRFAPLPRDLHTASYEMGLTPRGDTEYWFEAGNATSDVYRVTALEPVELMPDSPTITITPPEYARATIDGETAHGLTDLSPLRGSEVKFTFAFTRPPAVAELRFSPAPAKLPVVTVPLAPAPDRRTMTASLTATEDGVYRLMLEAEGGIRTPASDDEPFGGKVAVKPDRPPVVLALKGAADGRKVRPHDRLALDARLADDVGVGAAAVEYRVNDDPKAASEPLKLDGAGRREASAKQSFSLSGKAKAGDVLHYRLRFEDNRPAAFGGPNVVYHPEDKWFTLEVADSAASPREEEINARREAVEKKLAEAEAELRKEARAAYKARVEARAEEDQTPEAKAQLEAVKEQNRQVQKTLEEAAREAEKDDELQPLAEGARAVAAKEMNDAGKALERAGDAKAPQPRREGAFQAAENELSAALDKLERLRKENDRLAKDRLDQAKVEALADKQKALADEAAAGKRDADELKREQAEVEAELEKLTRDSDLLKKTLDEARAEQARKEAEKAAELAKDQRELAAAIDAAEKARNAERLAELAKKQEALAAKAERLAKDTEKAMKADRAAPLKPDDAKGAAKSLEQGDADKAMTEQDRAARDFDKLARDLERLAELAKDPREAARQLALMQEELARKAKKEPPAEMAKEQAAIRDALKDLSTPPARKDIAVQKKRADEALARAEKALAEGKKDDAALDRAKENLRKLAGMMPTLEERKEQAKYDLERIAREQDALSRKPAADGKKQADLAEKLDKLDAPGQEARRERAKEQMAEAAKKLDDRKPGEAKAAQDGVKKELDRLKEAMEGRKPADEKAAELAKRQRDLAEKAAKADASTPKAKLDELKHEQNRLTWETEALPAPEAEAARKDAAKAVRDAAKESNVNGPTAPDARKAMEQAAKKLDDLSRALGGEKKDEKPSPLANKGQAGAAKDLAKEQRELRDAVKREMARGESSPGDDKGGQLAKEQEAIGKEAAKLAKDVTGEQGEKSSPGRKADAAGKAAEQAAKELTRGEMQKGAEAGKEAEGQLKELAKALQDTPRGAGKGDTLEQARKLAARQEKVNEELGPLSQDKTAAKGRQAARQGELEKMAGDLAKRLGELGDKAKPGADAAREAKESMRQAGEMGKKDNPGPARTAREKAAKALDRAAEKASTAAGQPKGGGEAGKSLADAKGQMGEAKEKLGKGNDAAPSMASAGQALRDAAESLAKMMQPPGKPARDGQPGPGGVAMGGTPDGKTDVTTPLGFDPKKWGELPGELKTKITQDMRAKFGDDYARMIKLYFEQLADTRKQK